MMVSETIRFAMVGLLNTAVGYGAYYIFLSFLGLSYIPSLLFAHIVGIIHSYFWNSRWTFRQRQVKTSSVVKFIAVYVLTFLLNLLLLSLLVWFYNPLISQALAMLFTTAISFLGHKFWSFQNKKNGESIS